MNFRISHVFKIPNILCYIRILLVPVFCIKFLGADSVNDYYVAAGIVLLSGITDFLDGQIARRFHMITDLGKIIDPLADKLTQFAILISLTLKIKFMYLLVIFLIVKELTMALAGFWVYKKYKRRLNGAKWYGKLCTAVLYISMLILIAFPDLSSGICYALLLICGCVLLLAYVMYIRIYLKMIQDSKEGSGNNFVY